MPDRHTFSGTASYVTGSHAFKTGFQLGKGGNIQQRQTNGGIDLVQEYSNLVPVSVVVSNTPVFTEEKIKYDLGIFVQDSWAFKRLTVNPGLRIELFNTYVATQAAPAGRFVPAREFNKIENLPDWKDWAPRLGAVYDLFGDGRTALKMHVGKYMRAFSTVGFANVYNPMAFQQDRRTWSDPNGDDIAQDNEIGPAEYSLQCQRRQQQDARSEYPAAVPMGYSPGDSARGRTHRLGVRQLGPARLPAPVLDRQRPHHP